MSQYRVVFIYSPSPFPGRSPLQRGYFPFSLTEKFMSALSLALQPSGHDVQLAVDNTESDIELLLAQKVDFLVCAPGLRLQFYHQGFNPQQIIWLNVTEFMNSDARATALRIRAMIGDKEKSSVLLSPDL